MRDEYHDKPPEFDDFGINLADPHDRRGLKTEYISLLQTMALERYVGTGTGPALDLGCGYGRMTRRIAELGYTMIGMDPSHRVLAYAQRSEPNVAWCVGRMPELPVVSGSLPLVLLLNVVRALHLMGLKDVCADAARIVAPKGRLVVLDNVRAGDARYVEEKWFVEFFGAHGLRLVRRVSIRASRSPWIYMIRYGLIPKRWFARLAEWEIDRMARKQGLPRWCYHNVLFVFERA